MKFLAMAFSLVFGQPQVKEPAPSGVQLVVVSASWCGPCQRLKLLTLPEVKKSVPVEIVDGDSDKSYQVSSYPTTICFIDGKEQWRMSGFVSASTILERVKLSVAHPTSPPKPKAKERLGYTEIYARVQHGESLMVAVGVNDDADVYVKSIKGCEPGLWHCFLEDGTPKMQKVIR